MPSVTDSPRQSALRGEREVRFASTNVLPPATSGATPRAAAGPQQTSVATATSHHHPEDFISRALKLHGAEEAAAYASLTVPWQLRPINEPTSTNSLLRVLGSSYLWWKLLYAFRMAFVAMLPVAALIAAPSTTGAFASKAFATSGALITAVETFGGSLNATWAWLKCLPLCLPLLTLYTYIEVYNDPYVWGAVYVGTLALGAFLCENLTRRLSLLLTTVVMVGQLRARYDGHGKGMDLSFPTRIAAEYTLGCATGILATLLPWPRYAALRVDKKLAEAASNLSLCFSGLCDSFWTETNMQRRANMVRIELAKKSALNNIADAHHCLEVCRFEPQAREHLHLRQAKNELLSSFLPTIDSALRLLEAITDDQSVIAEDAAREGFGRYVSGPLKELAAAMDAALFLIARATRLSDLYPSDASSAAGRHGAAAAAKAADGDAAKGSIYLQKSRRDQQRPVAGMGMGLHPIRRVKMASLKLEAAYARARRDLFYSASLNNARRATIAHPEALTTEQQQQQPSVDEAVDGLSIRRSPQQSPALAPLKVPQSHSRRMSMLGANAHHLRSGFSSVNDITLATGGGGALGCLPRDFSSSVNLSAAGPAAPFTLHVTSPSGTLAGQQKLTTPASRTAAIAAATYADRRAMTDGTQEFTAFMSFYMFTLTQFAKRTVRFPSQAAARVTGDHWVYAFWRDDVMGSFWASMRYFQEFAAFCLPCLSGWAFLANVPFNKRHHSAVKLREAIKVSVGMGLCVLFYYYTDRDYAFFGGPGIVAFIAANTTAEALAGSLVRMFGTLFGGVLGFFCARLTTTPVEKVSALMVLMLVFGFFRTGKQYGFGAVYGCFVIVPMLGANVSSDEAISRIIQITFAALIYTFVSAAIFPARPLVELQMARSSAIVAISDSLQRVIRAAVAPFPPPVEVQLDPSASAAGCSAAFPARRPFVGGQGTVVDVGLTPPLAPLSGVGTGSGADRRMSHLRISDPSGAIGGSPATTPTRRAAATAATASLMTPTTTTTTTSGGGGDSLWEADEEDWDLMGDHIEAFVFNETKSKVRLFSSSAAAAGGNSGGGDGGGGGEEAADLFTITRGRLAQRRVAEEEMQQQRQHGIVMAMDSSDAASSPSLVTPSGVVLAGAARVPNSATQPTASVTAVTVTRPADVPTRLAMASDPFIAAGEAAAVALDAAIKKAAEWMPFAETEPMLTRVPYPAQLSKETHDSLLKLRALADLMLDAVKSLRLRHSAPSPIFLAVFDDLEPHLIECVHHFYLVVDMIVVSLTRRHAGLVDEMIAASLRLEQKCAEAHNVKALGLMQLVKLGRIITDVIPAERARHLEKAVAVVRSSRNVSMDNVAAPLASGSSSNGADGAPPLVGVEASQREEEEEKDAEAAVEELHATLMAEYHSGRFPGAVWQWTGAQLTALATAMVREVFEPEYAAVLQQAQAEAAAAASPLSAASKSPMPLQQEDRRVACEALPAMASTSNNDYLISNKSFTGYVVQRTAAAATAEAIDSRSSVIVTSAQLSLGGVGTAAAATLNALLSQQQQQHLPHGRKLKLLMTNADALGLHTLTLSLVIFSKEAKRLIMSVEGLQQHMLLVT